MSCERGVEAVPRVALRGGRGDGDEPGLRGAASGLVRRLRDGAGRGEAAGGAPGRKRGGACGLRPGDRAACYRCGVGGGDGIFFKNSLDFNFQLVLNYSTLSI